VIDASRMWYVVAAVAVLALGLNLVRQPNRDPSAEPVAIVTVKDGTGIRTETITQGQCLSQPRRVWVALDEGAECIAYIAPAGGVKGETAVVYFEGDVSEEDGRPEHASRMLAGYQLRVSKAQSQFGLPFIVIARPGLLGSSGFHLIGGRRDEGEAMSAAIDALKQRYGLRRFALAGQSGGARIIAQLLVLGRRDVLCAAMASGAYGIPLAKGGGQVPTNIFGEAGRKYLVPMHHADGIVASADRRTFVIGDPRDQRTPFAGQREWADKMRALGHHALLLEAVAQDSEHHGLGAVSLYVAGMCASGRSDAQVAASVAAGNKARTVGSP
jgi:pimeloyl-ACP methyl ester carboxylesterase